MSRTVGIGHDPHRDLVEIRLAPFPIVGEPLERDVGILDPLGDLEGARAHRPTAKVSAMLLHSRGRDHESGTLGERSQQRWERLLQLEDDLVRIGDSHRGDCRFDEGP